MTDQPDTPDTAGRRIREHAEQLAAAAALDMHLEPA